MKKISFLPNLHFLYYTKTFQFLYQVFIGRSKKLRNLCDEHTELLILPKGKFLELPEWVWVFCSHLRLVIDNFFEPSTTFGLILIGWLGGAEFLGEIPLPALKKKSKLLGNLISIIPTDQQKRTLVSSYSNRYQYKINISISPNFNVRSPKLYPLIFPSETSSEWTQEFKVFI